MGLSVNTFTYDGDTDFDLNFAGGYSSELDLACYTIQDDVPVEVPFDFLDYSKVRIDDSGLEVGDEIFFTRTVDKSNLPEDLTPPNGLTREAVQSNLLHVLYAYHEILDGRFADLVEVDDAVFTLVNSAVAASLENFVFSSEFKRDIVLQPTLTAAEKVTYTSGDYFGVAADVQVFVETNPATEIEVNVINGGTVVWTCTIGTGGGVTIDSTNDINLTAGAIEVSVTGDDYVSGADIAIVLPVINRALIDFEEAVSDYIATFNAEFEA